MNNAKEKERVRKTENRLIALNENLLFFLFFFFWFRILLLDNFTLSIEFIDCFFYFVRYDQDIRKNREKIESSIHFLFNHSMYACVISLIFFLLHFASVCLSLLFLSIQFQLVLFVWKYAKSNFRYVTFSFSIFCCFFFVLFLR